MRRPSLWAVGWSVITLGIAIALCFVPLFNLLAFEFAMAMTVPVALLGAAAGIRTVRRARRRWAPGALRGPLVAWRMWLHATLRALPIALLPLAPITLNALRVQNCDYLEGLIFYGVLPGISLPVAAAWGVVAGLASPRWPRLWFGAGVLVSLLGVLAWFWWSPTVDVFHPLVGYFPGSLYDEVLHLDARLLWSRALDVSWAAWALALSRLLYTPLGVRLRLRADAPARLLSRTPGLAVIFWALTLGVSWVHLRAVRLDLYRTPGHVQQRLGGAVTTEHLQVYFPGDWSTERAALVVKDLEFVWGELVGFFGFEPSRRIEVYIYPDAHMKKRLMGAGRTRIAKPWQYGFHVHSTNVGDDVTMHEMAHVFSADIANSPHHLSLNAHLLPNMALIEGLAEAATWDGKVLDFHQWSAAMDTLGIAPPIDGLLSPQGFYAYSPRKAYTVCGSFVRHLRDTRGPDVLAEAYRTGDVARAAGAPLETLVADWKAHIQARPLSETALQVAKARFDRPSIFGKVCAHEIAALRVESRQRADLARAMAATKAILGFIPGDPEARLAQIELHLRQSDSSRAERLAAELARDERVGRVRQARAREWQGDLAAHGGRLDEARAHYDAVLAQAFERNQARRVAVKRAALDEAEGGPLVRSLLDASRKSPEDVQALVEALLSVAPDWPVARYLAARQQVFKDEPDRAIRGLRAAVAGGLPHPSLEMEALRLIGVARFRAERYSAAASAFSDAASRADLGLEAGERHALLRWARRSEAFARAPER